MKSVIVNYIPHKRPINVNFNNWFQCYKKDILNLYSIFKESINDNYKYNKIDWETDIIFKKFVYLIFNSSSKYISS